MYLTLSTIGQQAIQSAKDGGYKLEIGTARLFRTGTASNLLPLKLTTAMLDANIQGGWSTVASNLSVIDEFSLTAPDTFQMVVKVPTTVGDFEFDAVGIYLVGGVLLGIGTYERYIPKVTMGEDKTSNRLELEVFIRHASIAGVIKVTRDTLLRPYSYITEFENADSLNNASDNLERIYRITRPTNALGSGKNAFTTFIVHAGTALFDDQNKTYHKAVWVPSDHMALLGSDTLPCRLVTNNTMSIRVPKNQFPMIEHIQSEVPYLIATTELGNTPPPGTLRGRLLEATLNVVAEADTYFDVVLLLTHSTFQDVSMRDINFGAILYASNTDLSAQTAVRVALRKFIEMQYDIGRTYKSDQPTDPNDVLMPFLGYRTYWIKLNGMVEASTSTTDGRLLSAGQIYDLPDYATGGETLLAPVLRATNLWLRYDPSSSGSVTYDISSDRTAVNEGGVVRFTLRTTGLSNGSLVAYDASGIQAEDLTAGSLSGYFTIQNNVGIMDMTLKPDELTEGDEDLRVTVVADPSIFSVVTVRDTSIALDVSAFIAVAPTANTGITTMNEGDTRYFVALCGGVPDGTYLYPTFMQNSTASVYDLSQSLPSSLRVSEGRVSCPITAVNDRVSEGDEVLSIGLYRDAQFTDSLVSASVTIKDTSRASTINSFFSTKADGSDDISGATVDEGSYVYLIIETTGYEANTTFNLRYANSSTPSSSEVENKDFATIRPSTVNLDGAGRAFITYALSSDFNNDRPLASDLETFHVEVLNTTIGTVLTRSMVYVRDVSRTASGAFTISDITSPTNDFVVYNSQIDKPATLDPQLSDTGSGPRSGANIALACTPLDIGLVGGRKYRLTWIQSETASSAVTRAIATISVGDGIVSTGAGLSSTDVNSTTSGKVLSMISGKNGTTLGYGAVFEFQISNANMNQRYPINIWTYYPNGAPGLVGAVTKPSDCWSLAGQHVIPMRNANDQPYLLNDYDPTGSKDPKNGMMGKIVHIPFGGYVDLLIITPSGAGGTSSTATEGTGIDGQNGRTLKVHVPKYVGSDILESTQPKVTVQGSLVPKPYAWKYTNLWNAIYTITGGRGGKSQGFSDALSTLGGVSGTMTISPTKVADLDALNNSKLFARDDNLSLEYEVICELITEVSGKSYQTGRSTNASQEGGLGFLPQGLINSAENMKGAGGNGGASIGTGYGYAGGGGSGSFYILRLGTRVLSEDFVPSPEFAPVTFYLTDGVALDIPVTDPLQSRIPFSKAIAQPVVGGNTGASGSELYVAQLDFQSDANKVLDRESLVGVGTASLFVRPTHNDASTPTLELKEQTVWDETQLNQLTVSKFGISRIVLLPTGVEGSYTNEALEVVSGKPSKASNLLMYQTLNPDNAIPNESLGSTLVHVPVASGGAKSVPVINRNKLSTVPNTSVLISTVKDGDQALADGDNEYSLGGFVEMFLSNNSTTSKSFLAHLPRVDLSDDNPAKVIDPTEYASGKNWSTELDEDGNSLSSLGYMIAEGDGVLSVQNYILSNLIRLRPWIKMPLKPTSLTDTNAPIIIQQGQLVTLTIIGGGGAVSEREADVEVTTNDAEFNGQALTLSIKSLTAETFTPFLVCDGGLGSIDNTTNPVSAGAVATLTGSAIANCLKIVGTPVLTNGINNPLKGTHGGIGSGAYASVTLMNYYPMPVVIKATGGRGGSGLETLQTSDGVVLITVQ